MNLHSKIERMEALLCPLCALQVPDSPEAICLETRCPLCGAPVKWDVSRLNEREREAFTVLRSCAFGSGLDNPRLRAMACWLTRREDERQDHEKERASLEARAHYDASARLRLVFMDKVESRNRAMWDEWLGKAPDETLQAIVDTEGMSDAELEAIIWPEEIQ
jgi:hypothetical protein